MREHRDPWIDFTSGLGPGEDQAVGKGGVLGWITGIGGDLRMMHKPSAVESSRLTL